MRFLTMILVLVGFASCHVKFKDMNEEEEVPLNEITMGHFQEGDHADGLSITWPGLTYEEFLEEYPDSHFLHIQFDDAVITIDWSHAKFEAVQEGR